MRIAVTFFLFLCFHLLAGHNSAYTSDCKGEISYFPALNFEGPSQLAPTTEKQRYLLTTDHDLEDENDYVVNVEDDDEDFIRKNLSFSRCVLSPFHAFNSTDSYSYQAYYLSSYNHPLYRGSCKYIEQRTLRI